MQDLAPFKHWHWSPAVHSPLFLQVEISNDCFWAATTGARWKCQLQQWPKRPFLLQNHTVLQRKDLVFNAEMLLPNQLTASTVTRQYPLTFSPVLVKFSTCKAQQDREWRAIHQGGCVWCTVGNTTRTEEHPKELLRKKRVTTQPSATDKTTTFIIKGGVTPGCTEVVLRFVLFRGELASWERSCWTRHLDS